MFVIGNCSGYMAGWRRLSALTIELPHELAFKEQTGLARRRTAPGVGLWTNGQFQLALEPAGLPWTTLRVDHRASLCPLDHSP
jgi:hypothetical protein